MGTAVKIREDLSAEELRQLGARSKETNQSHRFLSLAAVRDGMSKTNAARLNSPLQCIRLGESP